MDDDKMNNHNRVKLILKIAGLSLLAVGLALVVTAFIDFFSKIMSDNIEMPTKFWMFFLGFPAMAIGGALTMFGFKKGIITYVKNETVPVINEAASELDSAFTNIAHSINKGISGDDEKCSCGAFNNKGSIFCQQCGIALKKDCPHCGTKNNGKAQYCNKCGTKL